LKNEYKKSRFIRSLFLAVKLSILFIKFISFAESESSPLLPAEMFFHKMFLIAPVRAFPPNFGDTPLSLRCLENSGDIFYYIFLLLLSG